MNEAVKLVDVRIAKVSPTTGLGPLTTRVPPEIFTEPFTATASLVPEAISIDKIPPLSTVRLLIKPSGPISPSL